MDQAIRERMDAQLPDIRLPRYREERTHGRETV